MSVYTMKNEISQQLAKETFGYGDYDIVVTVALEHKKKWMDDVVLNSASGTHYYRIVTVEAYEQDERKGALNQEIKNETLVAVDVQTHQDHWLFGERQVNTIPGVPEHVERTVRPVLKELDAMYRYVGADMEIDIDVAMERVKHEQSWADVADETERISQEIDSLAEAG